MTSSLNRRDFFRAGAGLAAGVAAMASGTAPLDAQGLTFGYLAFNDNEVIEGLTIERMAVGILVRGKNITIKRCKFRHLLSHGSSGSGIVVRKECVNIRIIDTEIDGRDSLSHGAGIALHPGSRGVQITDCYIHHMQHVGLSMGSTTYVDFLPDGLPVQSEHYVTRNVIEYCGTAGDSGDAGSGIVIVGQSHRHTLRENRVRRNTGHGIVLSGSRQGNGALGTPAFDESPTWNTVAENIVEYNGGDGILNNGANYTWIRDNFCYANGAEPIRVISLGGLPDARGVEMSSNREVY